MCCTAIFSNWTHFKLRKNSRHGVDRDKFFKDAMSLIPRYPYNFTIIFMKCCYSRFNGILFTILSIMLCDQLHV